MRVAVIDIGSNSTRLLVCDASEGQLREIARSNRVTRLGEGVDRSGELTAGARERTLTAVCEFARRARELGSERIVAVATQAVREARNGHLFVAELASRCGVEARVLSGTDEARLTFIGAVCTQGSRPAAVAGGATADQVTAVDRGAAAGRQPAVAVIDVGGGSTEIAIGDAVGNFWAEVSLPLGVVRQTERHLRHDPPCAEELEALEHEACAVLAEGVARLGATAERVAWRGGDRSLEVARAIAVAGTATSLAAIDQRLDPYDPQRVHGYELSVTRVRELLGELAALPLAERRRLPGLHPDRAPTIVAGCVILLCALRSLAVDAVTVSEHDLLHGVAAATALKSCATSVEFGRKTGERWRAGL